MDLRVPLRSFFWRLGRFLSSRFFRSINHINRFRATCRFLCSRFFHFSDQETPTERNDNDRFLSNRFFRSINHKNRYRADFRFLSSRFFHFSDEEKPIERNRLAIWSIFLEKPTGWRYRFFLSKNSKPGQYTLSHARTSTIPYRRAW